MLFATQKPLLPLPPWNPLNYDIVDDSVGLKTCLRVTSSLMASSTSFPWCTYNPTSLIRHPLIRQPQHNGPIVRGAPQLGDTNYQNWRTLNSPPSIPEGTSTPSPTWEASCGPGTPPSFHTTSKAWKDETKHRDIRGLSTSLFASRPDWKGIMSKGDARSTCALTVYMRSQMRSPGHHLHSTQPPRHEKMKQNTGISEGFHITIRFKTGLKRHPEQRRCLKHVCLDRLHEKPNAIPRTPPSFHTTSKTRKYETKHRDIWGLSHHYSLRHWTSWAKAMP